MLHSIQNEFLTVTAAERGAELQSIRSSGGTEYLWQGDGRYWRDRALNLFPYVARLTEGRFRMDGRLYTMDIHGLAPYADFQPVEKGDTHLTLELAAGGETLAHYPRDFRFRVIYDLEQSTLHVTYEVENRDRRTMYFGLGGHPGFNVPLAAGARFEDYRLRFSHPCRPTRVGFTEQCFLSGEDTPYPLEDDRFLPLRHSLFDADAVVLRDMDRAVTLERPGGGPAVTVSFPQMPVLGIWHAPRTDAPYVCLEPWCSLPSRQGEIAVFEEQPDLLRLAPGGVFRCPWSVTLHE